MYKTVLVIIIIFFVSCSLSKTQVSTSGTKKFKNEDIYIIAALSAKRMKEYSNASNIFYSLYKKSSKKEYLYKSFENALLAKKSTKRYEEMLSILQEHLQDSLEDSTLVRYKAIVLFELKKHKQAYTLMQRLIKKYKNVYDYTLLADFYLKEKKYDLAMKYLQSAYYQEYNENILSKMSIIMYVNLKKKKEAIALLDTHARVHGYSEIICKKLIAYYSNENNIDGLLWVYLHLYELQKDEISALKIIQIYEYKQEYIHLRTFLEKSGANNSRLLEIYSASKEYEKAYKLAHKLYIETAEYKYLALSATYRYELYPKDEKVLESTLNDLEIVVSKVEDPIYLNYLGYMLINREIDVNKGIMYVQRALKQEPRNGAYLDSLAWGYVKQKKCKKARAIFLQMKFTKFADDLIVLEHQRVAQKCYKNQKRKKKR